MELTDSFEPAGQDVVSEEIDGEVVIVNLKTGNYYSLTQSATVIWSRLARGETLEQIHGVLQRRYLGDAGVMCQGLADLIHAISGRRTACRGSSLRWRGIRISTSSSATTSSSYRRSSTRRPGRDST